MPLFSSSPQRDRGSPARHRNDNGPTRERPQARYLDERGPDEPEDNGPMRQARSERSDERDECEGERPRFSGGKAIRMARQFLSELTGQAAESVSGLSPCEGGWKVTLDVVELERIPRTTDVLASYELQLDDQGELVGYRRLGRYYRNQVSSE